MPIFRPVARALAMTLAIMWEWPSSAPFMAKPIPDDADGPADEVSERCGDGDQGHCATEMERTDLVGRSKEMGQEDEIARRLGPSEQHEGGPDEVPATDEGSERQA